MDRRNKKRKKKQRSYQARLLRLDSSGKVAGVIASRDFKAVDETGAKRAASHWYKGLYPDEPVAGAHTAWEVQSPTTEQPEFHYCRTVHGLLAVHATDGKDIAQARVEEEVAGVDEDEIMRRLVANPQEVKKQYRGRATVLLGIMENYFTFHNPCHRYSLDDDKGLLEADLVYDWTGVPQMLARAWRAEPKYIRYLLRKEAIVECPFCGKQIEYKADRIPGGFEFSLANTPCPVCQTRLIEINSSALVTLPEKWRTAQSPYWIAPNPEQEREWAVKRLTLARDNPQRYFVVGKVKEKDRQKSSYVAFIEQVIRQIQPEARIVRFAAPDTKVGRAESQRVFFKAWAESLGGEGIKNTKEREAFVFDRVSKAADWLILDHAERLWEEVQRRLRGLDRDTFGPCWNQIPMVWLWNNGYYRKCLGGQRRIDLDSFDRDRREDKAPSPQVLWLPDSEQLDIEL